MNRIETTATLLAPAATPLRTAPTATPVATTPTVAVAETAAVAAVAGAATVAAAEAMVTLGYVPGPGAAVCTAIPGHLPSRQLLRIRHAVR